MAEMVQLHWPADKAPVLDLCQRASDYIRLETGRAPNMANVEDTMTDAPHGVPPHQVWCWGLAQGDGTLDGIATCLKGYYDPNDWYLGLLLLAPSARNAGLGARMARHVIRQATADGGTCLRIAVLDANPRGRAFWTRLGFEHEKSTDSGDGHLRHVHRMSLERNREGRGTA